MCYQSYVVTGAVRWDGRTTRTDHMDALSSVRLIKNIK